MEGLDETFGRQVAVGLRCGETRLLWLTSRFTCKTALFEEPTSGLKPLTCSLRVRFGPFARVRRSPQTRINKLVSRQAHAGELFRICLHWCTTGVLAHPARSEPATGGLEAPKSTFSTVLLRLRTRCR